MLVVLLTVLLRVRAEWVEIAQNSYRRTPLRRPAPTEFTPEPPRTYPNATLGAPDWHRGYVNRAGDVRRVPGAPRRPAPAQDAGAGAANKQEYYDIDGPGEGHVHEEGAPHGQESTEGPVTLSNLDYDDRGADSGDIRNLEKTPTESVKPIRNKNTQHTSIVNEKHQTDQRLNQSKDQEVAGDDHHHLNLHKMIQHFVETLKNPTEDASRKNLTKDVVLDIKNTLTQTASSEKSNQERDSDEQSTDAPKVALDSSKYIQGVLKMIRTVANIISKNTHSSVSSKIKYLEDLKNKLLYNIQERIDSVWPGADGAGRAARGAEARGHVELPSSEGALMTISFLTFAVFLIKLVLQIIHTYKNKTMMMTPAVVTAVGRAAAALSKN